MAAARKNNVRVWYTARRHEGHGFARKANADFHFLFDDRFFAGELPAGSNSLRCRAVALAPRRKRKCVRALAASQAVHGRPLSRSTLRNRQRHFQLPVALLCRVLRRVVDLDIGIRSVVLDSPAYVVEPERKLGLRSLGSVDERVPRPDADDAAPGPCADEPADSHQLEPVREDVAVGTRVLVGERDHGPGRGLVGIGPGLAPSLQVVADPCGQLSRRAATLAAAVVATPRSARRDRTRL